MSEFLQRLQDVLTSALRGASDLPWGMHALVGLLMVAGLVLWLSGQRVLKPAVVVFAGVMGALLGAIIVAMTPLSASASVWHGLGAGLFAGLLIGLLMFRSAIALGSGVVFGLLLPLSAACILSAINPATREALLRPATPEPSAVASAWSGPRPADALDVVLARFRESLSEQAGLPAASLDTVLAQASPVSPRPKAQPAKPDAVEPEAPRASAVQPALDRVHAFTTEAFGQAASVFNALPGTHRFAIALCAILGMAGGVVMGLNLAPWATSAVASLFGAALWVPALVWLSVAMSAPWSESLNRPALHWLIAWAGLGLLGVFVQWSGLLGGVPKAKKPAPAPAAKPA